MPNLQRLRIAVGDEIWPAVVDLPCLRRRWCDSCSPTEDIHSGEEEFAKMKKYEKWQGYPYNTYGNAVVLNDHLDYEWSEANLTHTQPKWNEDCNAQEYFVGYIVGYQTWTDDEGNKMYSFYDPENRRRVIEMLPHLVVETDPFGPDLCSNCGGPVCKPSPEPRSWWHRLLAPMLK